MLLYTRKISFLCILFCFVYSLSFGQNINDYRKLGVLQYKNERYHDAIKNLMLYQNEEPDNEQVLYLLGVSYLRIGDEANANRFLSYLNQTKKPDVLVFFQMGRLNHLQGNFEKAIRFYKKYIVESEEDAYYRDFAKDAIKRCGQALQMNTQNGNAIVDNMGGDVNSIYHDFAPILSPNRSKTIYYASSRVGNVGGQRDIEGKVNEMLGNYKTDMYRSASQNGFWTPPTVFKPVLNTPKDEVPIGFSKDGKELYYYEGFNLYEGDIKVDTFGVNRIPVNLNFTYPIGDKLGSLNYFNDSTLLIAANLKDSYGGLDLYLVTKNTDGTWNEPENLGASINSAYDEKHPFLANDGRTLYFSSNSTKSIGGFDVFKSTFIDKDLIWSTAENLGMPINSPGDDLYFKLSKDGLNAYFSSDRLGGNGMTDIYTVLFAQERIEQLAVKRPTSFNLVATYNVANNEEQTSIVQADIIEKPKEEVSNEPVKDFVVEPIFFKDADMLGGINNVTFNTIIKILGNYSGTKVLLTSHANNTASEKFRLYFSLKKAQKLKNDLIANGIDQNSIFIRAVGENYPIAKNDMAAGQKLNDRIDIQFFQTEGLPIKIFYKEPVVNTTLKNYRFQFYNEKIEGLTYKVQIAAIKRMYDNEILVNIPDATIENYGDDDFLRYSLGLLGTYRDAFDLKTDLENKGFDGAFIVAYYNGMRLLNDADVKLLAEKYPDLKNYMVAKGIK